MDLESQRSLANLAAIVQWSADAIVSTDDDHIVLSWNPAAERLFGFTAEEAIGQSFEVTVPPQHIAKRRQRMGTLAVGEAIEGIETSRVRKDGSLIDVEITVTAIQVDGTRLGFSSILRDVSERKAADELVRALEHRYRTFVEKMPALTYIVAPNGDEMPFQLLHVNERVEEMIGYTAEEWADNELYWHHIMHPDDRDQVYALNQETTASGEPYRAEYRMIAKDGRDVWVRDEAVLIRDEAGTPLYWLGFVIDISDLKRVEGEATRALAGQRAANIELERMSAIKSEFLSLISHEFRTPLTSIQGFSELIADESLAANEVREFAATINVSARRMARMINDLLDLERLESGRIEVQWESVDLNVVACEVIELLAPTATTHTFVTQLDPRLPLIVGDADLLCQVATNLVANAVKYSPAGGAVMVMTDHGPDTVRLSVSDQGIGIPQDALEMIFSRYARLVRPEHAGIEGTGLGLPIARQIVELHQGRIWAERASGRGSIFRVELPRTTSSRPS